MANFPFSYSRVQLDFIDEITKASRILQNFVLKRDGINYEETETCTLMEIEEFGKNSRGRGLEIRRPRSSVFSSTISVFIK